MAAEHQLTLADYVLIFRRRAILLVTVFVGVLAASLLIAVVVPSVYESTGTIMVESQRIQEDLSSTKADSVVDERIEVIRQRVITRENLLKIIDKFSLYSDSTRSLTSTEKIDLMRSQIGIEPLRVNTKNKRQQVTIAFKVSFEGRSPEVAQGVANALVTLFLDENIKTRTERATETTEFLTQEANKLKSELESVENQIAEYKQKNANALPEHLQVHMSMIGRAEAEIKELEREYRAIQEEIKSLQVELGAAKESRSKTARAGDDSSNHAEHLDKLKAEYARLLSQYTAEHPDVRALRRRIEALESNESTPAASGGRGLSLEAAKIQTRIDTGNARMDSISGQLMGLRGKLGSYERQITQTPQVERGLAALIRDHQNAQRKYEEIRAKQLNARITENLEQENKAERFALLEPPDKPVKPIRPDRIKIILVGFFGSIGAAFGLVYAVESMNRRIRGVDTLTAAMRHRPLVVIPYITTRDETAHLKKKVTVTLAIVGMGVMSALVALHFFYMPIDLLFFKVMGRFV
jgi:polysaccharide biosynthesis transport protein